MIQTVIFRHGRFEGPNASSLQDLALFSVAFTGQIARPAFMQELRVGLGLS